MAKEFMSVPPWLEVFLSITTFFNECEEHSEHIRRECNLYCFDCNGDKPLCSDCVKSCHKDHRIIQIRRSSYHDVVRVQDIEDELDTSGVQSYVINNFDVVFLNKRGFDVCRTKKNSKSCRNTSPCEICRRNISNAFRFCSLGCKFVWTKKGENENGSSDQTINNAENLREIEEEEITRRLASKKGRSNSRKRKKTSGAYSKSRKKKKTSGATSNSKQIKENPVATSNSRKRKGNPRRAPFY